MNAEEVAGNRLSARVVGCTFVVSNPHRRWFPGETQSRTLASALICVHLRFRILIRAAP